VSAQWLLVIQEQQLQGYIVMVELATVAAALLLVIVLYVMRCAHSIAQRLQHQPNKQILIKGLEAEHHCWCGAGWGVAAATAS
jgi:hypothetical protein